jgi:hypothetical protein
MKGYLGDSCMMSDILASTHVPDSHEASMYTSVVTPALDFHESFMVDGCLVIMSVGCA